MSPKQVTSDANISYECASSSQQNVTRSEPLTVEKLIEETVNSSFETSWFPGKHIAKRPLGKWLDYGNPDTFDMLCEKGIVAGCKYIKEMKIDAKTILDFFIKWRGIIEKERGDEFYELFSLKRNDEVPDKFTAQKICYTSLKGDNPYYGYALERATMIPYTDCFSQKTSTAGEIWLEEIFLQHILKEPLRYGLTYGKCKEDKLPLTQFIFLKKAEGYKTENTLYWFGRDKDSYKGPNCESCLLIHSPSETINRGLEHIYDLIDLALNGDLSVIPRIHWWIVQLAPTWRGPGGTAEMIVKTLCCLSNVELPPWKDGIAPSIEVLMQPDENQFCKSYWTLFSDESLKHRFE